MYFNNVKQKNVWGRSPQTFSQTLKTKIKKTNLKFGFTLIELLIVIAIVGILAGVILITMNSATNSARDVKIKAELAQIEKALLAYNATNSAFPIESTQCVIGQHVCYFKHCHSDTLCLRD